MSQFTIPERLDYTDAKHAFEFALAARSAGAENAALEHVLAAAKANPKHSGLWQMLGLYYRTLDQLAPAVEAFRHAANLAPNDPSIAHGHARVALEGGLPATQLYNTAQRLAPTDGAILIGRSAAQLAEGDTAAAISDLEIILENNPTWLEGHSALARLLWMTGNHDRLTKSVDTALVRTPNSPILWSQLTSTLFQTRQFENVLQAIENGRRELRQNDAFLFLEASSYAELGMTEKADNLFAKIGSTYNPMLVEHRIRHLLRSGRHWEARDFAEGFLNSSLHNLVLPYASIAWRLLGDDSWSRIENDPNLVGIYDIADELPSLDELAGKLRALHVTQHEPMEQSLRGGTQTDGPLLSRIDPVIQHLRKALMATVEKHAVSLVDSTVIKGGRAAGRPFYSFAGSWSVLLRGSGHHANHFHQAGWLSSALYVELPKQETMGPAPAGWFTIGQPPLELGIDLQPIRIVEPKPGRLILFPSTMWHGTLPINAGERLTVAFDVAPPTILNLSY